MDYEKEYKSLVAKVKKAHQFAQTDSTKSVLEDILPQLRESEDDRIRKWLVDYFGSIKEVVWIHLDITCEQILDWLEKQKEQRPALSEVDLLFRGEKVTVKRPFYRDDKGRGYSTAELDDGFAWNALRAWCEKKGISLYDLYPKAEWSEEDEDMLNSCISSIEEAKENRYAYKETDGDTSYDHEIAWLKSIRPSWKPSEDQMDALKELIDDANRDGWVTPGATELYEQLKKL